MNILLPLLIIVGIVAGSNNGQDETKDGDPDVKSEKVPANDRNRGGSGSGEQFEPSSESSSDVLETKETVEPETVEVVEESETLENDQDSDSSDPD